MAATIVGLRQDLRLQDNPALDAALRRGGPVIPLYIWDEAGEGKWRPGGASRSWLHGSLVALDESLRERGARLVVRRGESGEVLRDMIRETKASAVYWNRRYEPASIARDSVLKAGLGVETRSFNASLLFEPHAIAKKTGGPFQVFTPFWRHCLTMAVEEPVRISARQFSAPERWPRSLGIDELKLRPKLGWDRGFYPRWQPGEAGAQRQLQTFIAEALAAYADRRDEPAVEGTSALSPHLHFGEIGPRQIWQAIRAISQPSGVFPPHRGAQVYLTELGWREFAHHLLFHFPTTPDRPLREEFGAFPWRRAPADLRAWQMAETGYPIVDAGMRELWQTGWMHNRVRMIVASFLVKHLRLPWTDGAAWFWDTLVDADLANNTLGWQWSAGCGADAAPYFRIFNPILQGRKFDPDGAYVKRWLPELAGLPAEYVHAPWEAPNQALRGAGVELGRNYPRPIVDHAEARQAALDALAKMRSLRGAGFVPRTP